MSVAILGSGPSLQSFPSSRFLYPYHSSTIAINRAILHCPQATYWAFLDWPVFMDVTKRDRLNPLFPQIPPTARILTDHSCADEVRRTGHPHVNNWHWDGAFGDIRAAKRTSGLPPRHARWTATCSLVYAWKTLKTDHIFCYGMDLAGTRDFDGYSHPRCSRSSSRWEKEAETLGLLFELMRADGVQVTKVEPPKGAIDVEKDPPQNGKVPSPVGVKKTIT